MELAVDGRRAFAYTASHAFDPKKPTLVFIHGAGLDHSLFGLQSRYFGYHGRNVLALDLPAHGRSEGPPLATIGAMADWMFSVLDAQDIAAASIVGHSMGALVALEAANREPKRVERIACLGIAYPMKVSEAFLEAAHKNEQTAFDMETIWGHAPQVPFGGNPNPGMWMYGDMLARLARLAPGVLYNDLKACNDYVSDFAGVECPVLFILGRRDVMTPPRAATALTQKLAGAQVEVVEFSGHSLMAEAPDDTLDALVEFFSEIRTNRPGG
ncbi:MAG: alpha/beta fold hydrolase [Burkholderiales bacterium]